MAERSKALRGDRRRPASAQPPGGLTPAQYAFCLAWRRNGFNATAAYKVSHPETCKSNRTAWQNGWRTLRHAKVQAFLGKDLEQHWSDQHLTGSEALMRVGLDATFDIRELFDATGALLPPHLWPDAISGSVKAIHVGAHGMKVSLVDPLAARRLILEVTGKVKGTDLDELAEALRATLKQNTNV